MLPGAAARGLQAADALLDAVGTLLAASASKRRSVSRLTTR
jgi:hypothetical protein